MKCVVKLALSVFVAVLGLDDINAPTGAVNVYQNPTVYDHPASIPNYPLSVPVSQQQPDEIYIPVPYNQTRSHVLGEQTFGGTPQPLGR